VRRATRIAAASGAALAALAALIAPPSGATAEEIDSAIARGGRLYDDWHTELDLHERHISHLPRPDVSGAAASGDGLCVSCHGWDYHGLPWADGGSIAGMAGADTTAIEAVLTNATHGYGTYMDETDLHDLALFVSKGQFDMTQWIDVSSGKAKGNAEAGAVFFQSICAGCHGADGMDVTDMPPLGTFGRREPWHALHIMMNGHPNGSMPPLRVLNPVDLANTLAYIQALPDRPVIASVVRGGRLYDTWPTEAGRAVPEGWHPAWPQEQRIDAEDKGGDALERAQARSWRCVSCHGWDYRGRDGVVIGGTPPPFRGINRMEGAPIEDITAVLTDDTHGFGRLLSQRDIMDLATFVSIGQIDMAPWIHPDTGRFLANAEAYEGYYQTICATCHGADGREIKTMPPVGRAVTAEPKRALHSVFNGHPGEDMPPLRAMGVETAAGILSFAETLPTRKR